MSIELRLSDVDPPTPDPPRTMYRDIVNLPDPAKLGITIRYFNHDSVNLYFQITGAGTGYTFGTVNLGLLAPGTDAYYNLDEFASRAKPSAGDLTNGELEESVTLTLKAYTDAGYSNLKWTYDRVVGVHWINSADPAFTTNFLDNFDDGTVQGWAIENELNASGLVIGVSTDYVLSAPYSLRFYFTGPAVALCAYGEARARAYKQFTTPAASKVFAIFDVRLRPYADAYSESYAKYLRFLKDADVLVYIGKPYTAGAVNDAPVNKWIRIVVPLPPSTTLTLRVSVGKSNHCSSACPGGQNLYANMDDFKIISK